MMLVVILFVSSVYYFDKDCLFDFNFLSLSVSLSHKTLGTEVLFQDSHMMGKNKILQFKTFNFLKKFKLTIYSTRFKQITLYLSITITSTTKNTYRSPST